MDLRVLSFCEAVARTGSFTKAAEEMHVAQPALSMSIAKLEDELGTKLFFRLPRGAAPTPEGSLLLKRTARIFEEVASAKRELKDSSALGTGAVRIGFPPMYGLYYFPRLLMDFSRRHPGIEITAIEGSATAIQAQLDEGTLDLGMLESRRVDRKWESAFIGRDEMVMAVNAAHPLAGAKSLRPADLNGLAMIVLTPSFLQRQLLEEYCSARRVSYRRVMECNYVEMTIQAAVEGYGAATLLTSLVERVPGLRGISFDPRFDFGFELCWRKDRYLSKASRALVDFASGQAQEPAQARHR